MIYKSFVEKGDTVKIDYVGRLEDGKVIDTSLRDVAKEVNIYNSNRGYSPLEFTVGSGKLIRGVEEAVVGMEEGEVKEVKVPPEKAYGKDTHHPLAGKTLIFKIKVQEIFKSYEDVRVPV